MCSLMAEGTPASLDPLGWQVIPSEHKNTSNIQRRNLPWDTGDEIVLPENGCDLLSLGARGDLVAAETTEFQGWSDCVEEALWPRSPSSGAFKSDDGTATSASFIDVNNDSCTSPVPSDISGCSSDNETHRQVDTSGELRAGPGFQFVRANGRIIISAIREGGPACADGSLAPGDQLLMVDGLDLKNATLQQVRAALLGMHGSTVRLKVFTAAKKRTFEVALKRATRGRKLSLVDKLREMETRVVEQSSIIDLLRLQLSEAQIREAKLNEMLDLSAKDSGPVAFRHNRGMQQTEPSKVASVATRTVGSFFGLTDVINPIRNACTSEATASIAPSVQSCGRQKVDICREPPPSSSADENALPPEGDGLAQTCQLQNEEMRGVEKQQKREEEFEPIWSAAEIETIFRDSTQHFSIDAPTAHAPIKEGAGELATCQGELLHTANNIKKAAARGPQRPSDVTHVLADLDGTRNLPTPSESFTRRTPRQSSYLLQLSTSQSGLHVGMSPAPSSYSSNSIAFSTAHITRTAHTSRAPDTGTELRSKVTDRYQEVEQQHVITQKGSVSNGRWWKWTAFVSIAFLHLCLIACISCSTICESKSTYSCKMAVSDTLRTYEKSIGVGGRDNEKNGWWESISDRWNGFHKDHERSMGNDAKDVGVREIYTRKNNKCSDVTVRKFCDLCATAALARDQASEYVHTRFHSIVQFANMGSIPFSSTIPFN